MRRNKKKKCRGLWKFVPQPSTSHNTVLAHPPLRLIFACRVTTSHGLMAPHPHPVLSHSDWESQQQAYIIIAICVLHSDFFFFAVCIIHNHINFPNVPTEDDSLKVFMLYSDDL